MALVGPRPVPVDDPLASDLSHPRFSVRPGLVGLWWIRQQAKIDYDCENDTDREYVRTRSVRSDFFLLLRATVLLTRGRQGKRSTDRVPILGLPVHNVSMNEALDLIIGGLRQQSPMRVSFLNADCINVAARHPAYREVLHRAHLLLPDGIGLRMGARLLGYELRQNVNGTDLFPRLCARLANQKKRVFLLGARPGVADRVADWIERHHPDVVVGGTQHGYFDATQSDAVIERIRAAKPDLVFVAFGAPRQDLWIDKHLDATGARVGLGVGGLFDFYSGRVSRAPLWVREMGCEWMYRLAKEPRRLWRRYLYGNGLFLAHIWRERARRSTRKARAMELSVMNAVMCVPKRASHESISPVFGALLDRPFLQHVIERLVAQGFESLHLVTDRPTPSVNGFVGDGTRWGIHIELHETAGPADCCLLLQRLNPDRPFLLGRADRLVRRDLFSGTRRRIPSHPVSFVEHTRTTVGGKPWTGWGWVWPDMLHDLTATCLEELPRQEPPTHGHLVPGRGGRFWRQSDRRSELVTWHRDPPTYGHPEQRQGGHIWRKSDNTVHGQNAGSWPQALAGITDVADALARHPRVQAQPVDEVLRADTLEDLYYANQYALQNPKGMLVTGRTDGPDVRIGRGARIHPDVYLTAPVFIGADVEIGRGSVIGPSVAIGAGSIVEKNCVIERAVIPRGTYVGESLDVRDAIVEGEWLHHVRHHTSVHLTDEFLISPLTRSSSEDGVHVAISA